MSNKIVYYRQCRLIRKIKEGTSNMMSWIPEKYAVKDKVLKLKNSQDEWENGWVVRSASEDRLDESSLPDHHVAIKGHRKATGDDQPKHCGV